MRLLPPGYHGTVGSVHADRVTDVYPFEAELTLPCAPERLI
jgi:hypothetical protein